MPAGPTSRRFWTPEAAAALFAETDGLGREAMSGHAKHCHAGLYKSPPSCYSCGVKKSPAMISRLRPGSPAIRVCAQWRHEAFFRNEGLSFEDCLGQLVEFVEFVERQDYEIALLAEIKGIPAGTCLFVRHEKSPAIISRIRPGSPAIRVCAQWRHEAFFRNKGLSFEDCLGQLVEFFEFVEGQDYEIALLAEVRVISPSGTGGGTARTCLTGSRAGPTRASAP